MSDSPPGQPNIPSAGSAPGQVNSLSVSFELLVACARLLFENGQTTKRMEKALASLARALGCHLAIHPAWNALRLEVNDGAESRSETLPSRPAGVDMHRVSATMNLIDQLGNGQTSVAEATTALETIKHSPPVGIVRFSLMAAAGAAALAVIFGAEHLLTLVLIAISAGAGALLRRWLAGVTKNFFVQPFAAALLAGIGGAIAVHAEVSSSLRLVAVCPCMVLVPGPHILNGALDLIRMRINLGIARIVYASLITLMICAGLVLGLAILGVTLPAAGSTRSVVLIEDVLAAGVAVAAYGTFFNMSWSMIPIPVAVGMLAHACRWWALSAGADPVLGAMVACLIVGMVMTPTSAALRLPFAGLAFASVVSLIPGVYLFRVAGGMYDLILLSPQARPDVGAQIFSDGTIAVLIIIAMTFGLIAPKICLEGLNRRDRVPE
jgi:uncharacterized membrane protein YjjP (DUF1212 family)